MAKLRFHFSQLKEFPEDKLQRMVLHQLGSEELALQFENPNLNEMFYLTAEKALESVSMSAEHSLLLINNDETKIKEEEISKLILTFFEQLSVFFCFFIIL